MPLGIAIARSSISLEAVAVARLRLRTPPSPPKIAPQPEWLANMERNITPKLPHCSLHASIHPVNLPYPHSFSDLLYRPCLKLIQSVPCGNSTTSVRRGTLTDRPTPADRSRDRRSGTESGQVSRSILPTSRRLVGKDRKGYDGVFA